MCLTYYYFLFYREWSVDIDRQRCSYNIDGTLLTVSYWLHSYANCHTVSSIYEPRRQGFCEFCVCFRFIFLVLYITILCKDLIWMKFIVLKIEKKLKYICLNGVWCWEFWLIFLIGSEKSNWPFFFVYLAFRI